MRKKLVFFCLLAVLALFATDVAVAKSSSVTAGTAGADGRYVKDRNGVVLDTETGLEWVANPNEVMRFSNARHWVLKLKVSGGGWRMPSRDELSTLFQKGMGDRNRTPLLDSTSWFGWIAGGDGDDGWVMGFKHGAVYMSDEVSGRYDGSAFAVRARGE